MKKGILCILCITLALFALAYEKNGKVSLKSGAYILQNAQRDVPGDFTITIYDDGTFQSYETPISSYIGMGSYIIKGDVVTLKEDGAGCTGDINRYRIVDGHLLFLRDGSANYSFVPLEDGAAFMCASDVP